MSFHMPNIICVEGHANCQKCAIKLELACTGTHMGDTTTVTAADFHVCEYVLQ